MKIASLLLGREAADKLWVTAGVLRSDAGSGPYQKQPTLESKRQASKHPWNGSSEMRITML